MSKSNSWRNGWRIDGSSAVKTFDAGDRDFDTLEDILKGRGIKIYDAQARGIAVDVDYADTQDKTVTLPQVLFRELAGAKPKLLPQRPAEEEDIFMDSPVELARRKEPVKIYRGSKRPFFRNDGDEGFIRALIARGTIEPVFVSSEQVTSRTSRYSVSIVGRDLQRDEAERLSSILNHGTGNKFKIVENDPSGRTRLAAVFTFTAKSKNRHSVSNCAFNTSEMLGLEISNMSDLKLHKGIELYDPSRPSH